MLFQTLITIVDVAILLIGRGVWWIIDWLYALFVDAGRWRPWVVFWLVVVLAVVVAVTHG